MLQDIAGRLAKSEVPTDVHLAGLRRGRLVEELQVLEPGEEAAGTLAAALAGGLSERDVALRCLEMLGATVAAEAEATAATVAATTAAAAAASVTAGIGLKVGAMDGVRPGDIVGALTRAGGLRGEDVGRIDILPRMSVAEVPAGELDRLVEVLGRVQVCGQWLKPRVAEGWDFKPSRSPPRRP